MPQADNIEQYGAGPGQDLGWAGSHVDRWGRPLARPDGVTAGEAVAGAVAAGVVAWALYRLAGYAFRGEPGEARRGEARWGERAGVRTTAAARPVFYRPSVEVIEPDEQETIDEIIAVMRKSGELTRRRYGQAVRTSHAKAHGLVRGELRVFDDLPLKLRQGLFAKPATYPVIARLAQVPAELLDDRKVSTPRGMALKILGVKGEMLPGHEGRSTQDWLLDTGKVFIAPGLKTFLAQIAATDLTTPLPQGFKGAVSSAALAANKTLRAIGLNSANLDFYGHPPLHPLAEIYYSQCPMRFGDHIAKLAVIPDTAKLRALLGRRIRLNDKDALRRAVTSFLRRNPAEYIVAVQLCTDLERMPIENANQEWSEEESPYRPVARLILPPQNAWSAARRAFVDGELSFSPSHSLAAHRPLGAIMRGRMKAYEVLGRERLEQNGRRAREPRSIDEMPR